MNQLLIPPYGHMTVPEEFHVSSPKEINKILPNKQAQYKLSIQSFQTMLTQRTSANQIYKIEDEQK